MEKTIYDAAVIGAGVTGAFTARALSRYNVKAILLESGHDVSWGATKANSAIVHAGFDAVPGTLKAKLGLQGSEMMEKVASDLGVPYRRNGSLVIGDADEKPMIEMLYGRGITTGVKDMRIIGREELHALEPNVAEQAEYALYAPTGAIICTYGLAIAAAGNAIDNGVELRCDFKVVNAEREDDHFILTAENGSQICAKHVVNAAGVYSDFIAGLFGDHSFRIQARRGEYYIFDKEYGKMFNATIFRAPSKMGKGIIISPTVDGNLLLGPTAHNTDDREDRSTTAAGLKEMADASVRYCARMPFNSVITTFCGIRAVGDTGDYILTNPVKGLVNAGGVESPGLSSSPAIAEYLLGLLREDGLILEEKKDYNPIRKPWDWFRKLSDEEKNEVIKKNPSFGRVVCRCETITEGEIIEALHANPKATSVEGVKKRVRAGMGRCQGGFCSPTVMELISKELGIPYEEVTKHGGDSKIVSGQIKGE